MLRRPVLANSEVRYEAEERDDDTVVVVVVAEEIPHVDVGILLVGRDAKVGVLHCVLQEIVEREG